MITKGEKKKKFRHILTLSIIIQNFLEWMPHMVTFDHLWFNSPWALCLARDAQSSTEKRAADQTKTLQSQHITEPQGHKHVRQLSGFILKHLWKLEKPLAQIQSSCGQTSLVPSFCLVLGLVQMLHSVPLFLPPELFHHEVSHLILWVSWLLI